MRGRPTAIRAATKRAIQLNPTLGRAQSNLTLESVAEQRARPSSVDLAAAAPEATEALAHYNLGRAFRQQGYYNEALREYRLALDRGEDRRLLLQAIAEVHLLKGEHAAALELYDGLVGELPDEPKVLNERGVVLHQLGKFDEALVSCFQLCPQPFQVNHFLGCIIFKYPEPVFLCDKIRLGTLQFC